MENKNAINSSLNDIVKEALNTDFETYSEEDWTKIQPQLSSATSSFNPLNNFDAEAIIKHYIKEHKSTLIYISIAVALVLIVIGISYNSNPSAELTPEIPENKPVEQTVTKVDSVRGADTLKTISKFTIPKKQVVDSSKLITPKALVPAPTPTVTVTKTVKEPESKKESVREKEEQKVSKKKKEDTLKNIEEIEVSAPKPTINVVKKKKAKDSVNNPQPKPVQETTPPAPPVEQNMVTTPEQTKTTTEDKKEGDSTEKKKRRIKRKKEELPDDQKPKTFEEVVE